MAASSRRSKYGSLDWEAHQSTLERLYLDEDGALKSVAEIMEREYGFGPRLERPLRVDLSDI